MTSPVEPWNWFGIIGASVGIVGCIVGVIGGAIGAMNRRDADKYRRLSNPWVELVSRGTGLEGGRLITIRIVNDEKSWWRVSKVKVTAPKEGQISEVAETLPDPVLGGEPIYAPKEWSRKLTGSIGNLHIVKPNEGKIALRVTLASRADPAIKINCDSLLS